MQSLNILLLVEDPDQAEQQTGSKNTTMAEGDAALATNLAELQDAVVDVLQALLSVLVFLVSFTHAVIRCVHACVGLLIWTLGVWLVGLKWLQAKVDTLHSGRAATWK